MLVWNGRLTVIGEESTKSIAGIACYPWLCVVSSSMRSTDDRQRTPRRSGGRLSPRTYTIALIDSIHHPPATGRPQATRTTCFRSPR